ncbi:MAG TPA: RNA methyltransferase [Acidimicrobiales bacterium]|nr:RNA methyltransferase [Acidimicrobiales bacterium]
MTRAAHRRIVSANDEFQLLEALLANRRKRKQQNAFLVHGVRSIEAAISSGWPLRALLVRDTADSRWADEIVRRAPVVEVIRVVAALHDQLSQREEGAEVLAVAEIQDRDLTSVAPTEDWPIVVAEGLQSPGNLGTILRSAQAIGAAGLVVTGHAADPYDPQAVRASTGALFTMPFYRAASVKEVISAVPGRAIGLHPDGDLIDEVDLSGPLLLIAGTESTGLSRNALEACDALASIPMTESTGSLNVATAVAIALAEVARRRRSSGQ